CERPHAALGHWPAVFRNRRLRPAFSGDRAGEQGTDSLRRRDSRPRQARGGLSRSAGICVVEHGGKFKPLRIGGRRLPNAAQTGAALRRFYDAAPTLPPPPKPMTWTDVARKLQSLYESLLRGPAS